jgi:adenylate kinase
VAIILRKSPYKLVDVYEQRNYSKEKTKENLGSEILGITAHDAISEFGSEKTFQVDTTNQIMKEITRKIHNIIKEKSSNDEVDWLSEIKQNNDLQKFFDY